VLSAHTLLVTGICVVYFGGMALLFAHIAGQARCEDDPPDPGDRERDQAEMRLAA
jgi:hypothetical protein